MTEALTADAAPARVEADRARIAQRLRELADSIEGGSEATLIEQAIPYRERQSTGYARWGVARAFQLVTRPDP